VLWSEAFDRGWSATAGGSTLRHVKPFGWENGFSITRRASVSITYAGQLRRYGLIALQIALVLALLVVAWRSRAASPSRPLRTNRRDL
jgi:preprotein translocase subunit SecF